MRRRPTSASIHLVDASGQRLPEGWITCVTSPRENQAIHLRLAEEWFFGWKNLDQLFDEQGSRIEADDRGTAHIKDLREGDCCALVRAEASGLRKYAFLDLEYSSQWTLSLEAPQRVRIRVSARDGARIGEVPLRLNARSSYFPVWTGALPPFETALEFHFPIDDAGLRRIDGDIMSLDRWRTKATFDFPCLEPPAPEIDPRRPEVELQLPPTGSLTLAFKPGWQGHSLLPSFVIVAAAKQSERLRSSAQLHAYRLAGAELHLPWVEIGIDLHVVGVPTGTEPWDVRHQIDKLFEHAVVVRGPSRKDEHERRVVRPR
ncbi:MAG: hypothetical protein JNM84_26395 [Planctomycetes bacterium]|nr:hypothetical protein [Planctomycetota bacterium]